MDDDFGSLHCEARPRPMKYQVNGLETPRPHHLCQES